jgi:predicted secreted protein
MPMPPIRFVTALAAVVCLAAAPARGQTLPPPQNVLALTASASVEVTKDLLNIVFATTREGSDAALVQRQLQQALDAALAEARRAARPGELEVQTGNFALYPRYEPKAAGIAGWQGTAELIVEGRDAEAIAQLAGRIQTMTVARTGFLLSREAREKVVSQVQAEAIARFRGRADEAARLFGFSGWTLREASLGGSVPPPFQPAARVRMAAAPMAEEPLPVEAGKATVTATVSGSVQLVK